MENPHTGSIAASAGILVPAGETRFIRFDTPCDAQPNRISYPRQTVPTQAPPFAGALVVSSDLTTYATMSNTVALPSVGVPEDGSIHKRPFCECTGEFRCGIRSRIGGIPDTQLGNQESCLRNCSLFHASAIDAWPDVDYRPRAVGSRSLQGIGRVSACRSSSTDARVTSSDSLSNAAAMRRISASASFQSFCSIASRTPGIVFTP